MSYELQGLPAAVKVGPFDYQLVVKEVIACPGIGEAWGVCMNNNQVIELARMWPSPVKAVDTLIHEIMHALFSVWNIPDRPDEETAVGSLSTGLTAVLFDNPELALWIMATLHANEEE